MKNVLTMSIPDLERDIKSVDWKSIRALIFGLYELKWDQGHKWSDEIIHDIERRESILRRELVARGILNKDNYDELRTMLATQRKRRSW